MIKLTIVVCLVALAISTNPAFGLHLDGYRDNVIMDAGFSEWKMMGPQRAIEQLSSWAEPPAYSGGVSNELVSRALCYRAHAKLLAGDAEAAMADADKSIKIDGRVALAYAIRGMIHSAMKNMDRALDDCDRALALDGGLGLGYLYRGIAKAQQGKFEAAISDFQNAIRDRRVATSAEKEIGIVKAEMAAAVGRNEYERKIQAAGGDNAPLSALIKLFIEARFLQRGDIFVTRKANGGGLYELRNFRYRTQEELITGTDDLNGVTCRVNVELRCSHYRKRTRPDGQWSDWTGRRSFITGGDDPEGLVAVKYLLEKRDGKWLPPRGSMPIIGDEFAAIGQSVLLPIELEKPDSAENRSNSSRAGTDPAVPKAPGALDCEFCKGTRKSPHTGEACVLCKSLGRIP